MKNNKGFTLVELLVTLGVISIVIVVSSDFFFNLVDTSVRVQNRNLVEQDYNFVATKISKLVQDSNSVTVSADTNTLTINLPTEVKVVSYDPVAQTLKLDNSTFTSESVKVITIASNIPIFKIVKPNDPQQIEFKARFVRDLGVSKFEYSQNLERIITVRKSYRN